MAYDYYCTGCGKTITQNEDGKNAVLFNMENLLTAGSGKFQIMKFRLSHKELTALWNRGKPSSDKGFNSCRLSLNELMKYIAGPNNLNDERVAGLSLQELENVGKYFGGSGTDISMGTGSFSFQSTENASVNMFGLEDEEESAPETDTTAAKSKSGESAEEEIPAAYRALLEKDTTNTDRVTSEDYILNDVKIIKNALAGKDSFDFDLKLDTEPDDAGGKVISGYTVKLSGNKYPCEEVRHCPHCGKKIFNFAGTAKHKAVVFIGRQRAGKTSAILALGHYALYGINANRARDIEEIWKGSLAIKEVLSAELLATAEERKKIEDELKLYSQGISPEKTNAAARTDAYSLTLRIQDITKKYHILTFTDLPGELNRNGGTVDRGKIMNTFPVAMTCDAYVTCFDATDQFGGDIDDACKWTESYQKMRCENSDESKYVPILVGFTKCPELEGGAHIPQSHKLPTPIRSSYYLLGENEALTGEHASDTYKYVMEQFENSGSLTKTYHSSLRCSPYGYPAPGSNALKENRNLEHHKPTPFNVPLFMRWLLAVNGIIPITASYQRYDGGARFEITEKFFSRPQYKDENPLDSDEALARCFLFENPGRFDKSLVELHDAKSQLLVEKAKMKLMKNGNLAMGKE